ncbi:MAG: C40 family peptidase [Muribaculaceae bacterium]|nr:C40 family peptidase [Muribaculaceae bacterium]
MVLLLCSIFTAYADEPSRGLVRLSVVPMRAAASHASEQVSQALMGTPVVILSDDGSWSLCETPDGYRGYIINHSLVPVTAECMEQWRRAPRVVVISPDEVRAVDGGGAPVTDLVAGCILEVGDGGSLLTPDGRAIRILPSGIVAPFGQWAGAPFRPEALPRFASYYIGVPYLWGGLSGKGMDCSGLVRMAYMAQGRLLPRDARDQALEGEEVAAEDLQPGDLIFFGNAATGRVTHVAIYEGGGVYVHSSQMVRRNSLDERSPLYLPLTVLARRRISGTPLAGHPAYF